MKLNLATVFALLLAAGITAPALADAQEQQIGQSVYQQLSRSGEILSKSPYSATLNSIADRIKRVAD